MSLEIVIGLEIHLKLNSSTKLFCGCANVQEFDSLTPNTHVCPICTGQPGALPVLQPEALDKAILLGLALQCTIRDESFFDRKSYFYPDLPLGYQITQQWKPTCVDGTVDFWVDKEFTEMKSVRIRDAHIETDTGKTNQVDGGVALDRNRAGTPLVEIVTHPDFRSSDEVVAFLKELQKIARLHNISDAELESGQMRCDVNISLRPVGHDRFGTRVEMKNMSSWSAIADAIHHEQIRQEQVLEMGGIVDQETRGWDDANKVSYVMRTKENATDYRFMPEPDLPVVHLDPHHIDQIRLQCKELPVRTIERFKRDYGFHKEFINGVMVSILMQTYFESFIAVGYDPKMVATRLVGPIARRANDQESNTKLSNQQVPPLFEGGNGRTCLASSEAQGGNISSTRTGWYNENEKDVDSLPFSRDFLALFFDCLNNGKLTAQTGKSVIQEMIQTGVGPLEAMEKLGIRAISPEQIDEWLHQIFIEKPELLSDLKGGNMKPLGFVTGQVMKMSGGSADPQMVKNRIDVKVGTSR